MGVIFVIHNERLSTILEFMLMTKGAGGAALDSFRMEVGHQKDPAVIRGLEFSTPLSHPATLPYFKLYCTTYFWGGVRS